MFWGGFFRAAARKKMEGPANLGAEERGVYREAFTGGGIELISHQEKPKHSCET